MNDSIPKSIKKQIKALSIEAYECELKNHLESLYSLFLEWKNKELSSGELSFRIHEYDKGPSKELYGRYNTLEPDMLVGFAIGNNILSETEIPEELMPYLENSIKFSREIKNQY